MSHIGIEHFIKVGKLEDIPILDSRVVKTPDANIALFRTRDDSVFAVRDECPHKKGPLSQGIVHGRSVTCPLHNWKIQLEDGQAMSPDVGCVQTFLVRVVHGVVYLDLAEKAPEKKAATG